MNHKMAAVLDDCLARIAKGETVESCLARYAEYENELRPLLETAVILNPVTPPRMVPSSVADGRQAMFAAVDRQFANPPVSKISFARYAQQLFTFLTGMEDINMTLVTRFATAAFIAIMAITGLGISAASANSIPGDTLYPVKTTTESIQLLLTSDQEQLEQELQERRQEEVREVLQIGRETTIHFQDEVTAISSTQWTIGGFTVLIDENSSIVGQTVVGNIMRVSAQTTAAGDLIAVRIALVSDLIPPMPTHDGYPGSNGTHTPPPMPTHVPTQVPPMPTHEPTHEPTQVPPMPTHEPTHEPTQVPPMPTHEPTHEPTQVPPMPTHEPTHVPPMPTHEPTHTPPMPTHVPTMPDHDPTHPTHPSHG